MSVKSATLFTIGFAGKSAEQFFEGLKSAGVTTLLDIRLKPDSQLAGFAKKRDLAYFLRECGGISYRHLPELAPSKELLEHFRAKHITWGEYEKLFALLMKERGAIGELTLADLDGGCLLCSEPTPKECHRRLVAEACAEKFPGLLVKHL